MYYISTIKRDGNNQLTGKAKYRVIFSMAVEHTKFEPVKTVKGSYGTVFLILMTKNYLKLGSFINPRKALGI